MLPDTTSGELKPAYPVIPAHIDTGGNNNDNQQAFGINPQLAVCRHCELCVVTNPKESKSACFGLSTQQQQRHDVQSQQPSTS